MARELLLQHYWEGKFGIQLIEPNHAIDPQQFEMWARYDDMPTGARRANLRDVQEEGVAQISLFCKANKGTSEIKAKARAIIKHFGVEVAHDMGEHTIYVMSSYMTQGLPDGQWYMLPITIEYQII